ncbi:MAG: hypothetical protein MUF54_20440 [Polyangiaceae bacterium]|jgi:hypothetical protein|nr:hypothetical protein [Polyangiaceae bacterium]
MNATLTFLRTVVFSAAALTTCLLGCGAGNDDEQETSPTSQVQEAKRVRRACMFDAKFRCKSATNGPESGRKVEWANTSYGYGLLPSRARGYAVDHFQDCWNDWESAFDMNEDALPACVDVDGLGRTFYQRREELRNKAPTCTVLQYGYWIRANDAGCSIGSGEDGWREKSMNEI